MGNELTGRTAELVLRAALGHPMSTAMYEGLAAGNAQWLVEEVAVCWAPTLQALRRAAAEKRTLILSREHPYYLHGGLHYAYGTDGLEAAMKDDPVVRAKKEIVNSGKLMVYRIGSAWDQFRPKAQSRALAAALGLQSLHSNPADRARGIVCTLPRTPLASLAGRLKTNHARIVGDPKAEVTRVAVLAGETDPSPALGALLSDPRIDGLIAGAGGVVDEVDGAIAYFRDVIGSGRRISMLAVGYGPSHDPGVADMAAYLRGLFPGRSVECWPIPDPTWIPRS